MRSFTIERKASIWLLAVVMTAALLVAGLGTTSQAKASCSSIHVTGRILKRDGTPLRRFGIAVYKLGADRVLDHSRANKKGGYALNICRSATLKQYASNHRGRLNLILVAHRWGSDNGTWWVKSSAMPYVNSKTTVPKGFVAAKAVTGRTGNARTDAAQTEMNLPPQTGTVDTTAEVAPTVMRIETAPHLHVDYRWTSNSNSDMKVVTSIDSGGYSAVGSAAIQKSGLYERASSLSPTKKNKYRAKLIKPVLDVSSNYICFSHAPFDGTSDSLSCITSSSGKWTGDIKRVNATYHSCQYGHGTQTRNEQDTSDMIGAGKRLTDSDGVAAFGMSFTFTTTYGNDTYARYVYEHGKGKRTWCISGNKRTLLDSSVFYVAYTATSCDPSGPATCKRKR